MRVFCLTQARMGSTRLPGKVLMDVAGKPLLYYHLQRVARCQSITQHWLTISEAATDDILAAYLEQQACRFFRGSEDDVLTRFYHTLLQAGALPDDIIIRLTGDCPLICPELIDLVVNAHQAANRDGYSYLSLEYFPRGFDVEVFSFKLLSLAYQNASSAAEREHVTMYLYSHGLFSLLPVQGGDKTWNKFRLCVDEDKDLQLIQKIAGHFGTDLVNTTASDICGFLQNRPDLVAINAQVVQKHQI